MVDPEIPLVPERFFPDSSSRVRVRVGQTVRRMSYSWSPAVLDLLLHLESEGFAGAPRALGFDDQGREVLTYIEGEVGLGDPSQGDRFDNRLPDFVWRDGLLVHLGALIRAYHDAAATFPWAGRVWCYETRQPVETICHNELFPQNTIFRAGVPAVTCSPGRPGAKPGLLTAVHRAPRARLGPSGLPR